MKGIFSSVLLLSSSGRLPPILCLSVTLSIKCFDASSNVEISPDDKLS